MGLMAGDEGDDGQMEGTPQARESEGAWGVTLGDLSWPWGDPSKEELQDWSGSGGDAGRGASGNIHLYQGYE